MTDLAKTIAPKSDQLNADDLIAGPLTITITEVRGCDEAEQPIAVHFEGDGGKPYKPCKSMRRVMVHCWGADGKAYAGRRLALYRDENVMFGGIRVGGTRISHMSHIDREMTMALTATRAKRSPYTVKPLRAEVHRAATRKSAEPAARSPEDEHPPEDSYTRGFGGAGAEAADEDASEAVKWMRGVYEDLEADPPVFKSTADLDDFFQDSANTSMFEALMAEDAAMGRRLEAALRGRGKALAGRKG